MNKESNEVASHLTITNIISATVTTYNNIPLQNLTILCYSLYAIFFSVVFFKHFAMCLLGRCGSLPECIAVLLQLLYSVLNVISMSLCDCWDILGCYTVDGC